MGIKVVSRLENPNGALIGFIVEREGKTRAVCKDDMIRLAKHKELDNAVYVNKGSTEFIRAKKRRFDTKVIYSTSSQNIKDTDRVETSTSSKGNQVKWNNGGMWIKADEFGYEGLAEEVSSILLMSIHGVKFVEYNTCKIQEEDKAYLGCCSKDMLKSGESLVSFIDLIETQLVPNDFKRAMKRTSTEGRAQLIREIILQVTGLDTLQYMTNCFCLDAIILNEDRHLNNLCVVRRGRETFVEAPIFDNGLSLLSDVKDYWNMPINNAIRKVKSKPISTDFRKQVDAVRKLGGKPLKINFNKLQDDLNKYENILYDRKYVETVKKVIRHRLRELEGLAWERI